LEIRELLLSRGLLHCVATRSAWCRRTRNGARVL
jgi:hypothetical protein